MRLIASSILIASYIGTCTGPPDFLHFKGGDDSEIDAGTFHAAFEKLSKMDKPDFSKLKGSFRKEDFDKMSAVLSKMPPKDIEKKMKEMKIPPLKMPVFNHEKVDYTHPPKETYPPKDWNHWHNKFTTTTEATTTASTTTEVSTTETTTALSTTVADTTVTTTVEVTTATTTAPLSTTVAETTVATTAEVTTATTTAPLSTTVAETTVATTAAVTTTPPPPTGIFI